MTDREPKQLGDAFYFRRESTAYKPYPHDISKPIFDLLVGEIPSKYYHLKFWPTKERALAALEKATKTE